MFYVRLIITAVRSLESNFLRSLLATLGVLIGVSSVVACMSIMEGFSNYFRDQFKSLGSSTLYVVPASIRLGGRINLPAQTLELKDAEMLVKDLPLDIQRIAPEAIGGAVVKRFEKSDDYVVVATTEAYFEIHDFKATSGRVLSKAESSDESQFVVCLGAAVSEKLFGGAGAVGQTVKVRNVGYRVVGVMEKRGDLAFLNVDKAVFIPVRTGLKRFFNRDFLDRMTISVTQPERIDAIDKSVAKAMRTAHRIRPGQKDDFETFKSDQMMQNMQELMFVWKAVFYSIAGISLVVGGIGIMNIMLVSVTERTREIGVRMAVGARRTDILVQFLAEALIISLLGGGFGLLLGTMFADILENVLKDTGMLKIDITGFVVVTAIGTSKTVGVLSGLYPAFKASRLDPVEALRYE